MRVPGKRTNWQGNGDRAASRPPSQGRGPDLAPHHVVATPDRPRHLTVSGVFELPLGRGRRWLNQAPKLLDGVVGGWAVQAVYNVQSGAAIGFGNILFYGRLQEMVLPRSERRVERWFNTAAGFERDPRRQLDSNIRTFPLRLTGLRSDGFNNWDISAHKEFRIRERLRFQLRAEAQDALNHAMFAAPNTAPTNTLFGQVSASIWGEQRRIAVGGKLMW